MRGLSAPQKAFRLVLAILTVLVINDALNALFDDGIDWFNAMASAIGFGVVAALVLWRFSGHQASY